MIHRYYLRLMQAGKIISLACQYISSAPLNPLSSLEIYSHCPEPLGNRELKFFSFTSIPTASPSNSQTADCLLPLASLH